MKKTAYSLSAGEGGIIIPYYYYWLQLEHYNF